MARHIYKKRSIDYILNNDPFLNNDLGFCSKHKMRPYYFRKEKWNLLIDNCSDCQRIKNKSLNNALN